MHNCITYSNYIYDIIVLSYHSIVLYIIYYFHDIIIWFTLQANHYSCIILHEHNTRDPFWLQGSDILTALGIDDTKTFASPGSNPMIQPFLLQNRCQEWISTGQFLCVKDEWNHARLVAEALFLQAAHHFACSICAEEKLWKTGRVFYVYQVCLG